MLYRDRASVVATLVVLGLVLAAFLEFPTWTHDLTVLGSPLRISISQTALMAPCWSASPVPGPMPSSARTPRRSASRRATVLSPGHCRPSACCWPPSCCPGAFAPLPTGRLFATGLILILVNQCRVLYRRSGQPPVPRRRVSLNGWAYFLALVVFTLIYSAKARSLSLPQAWPWSAPCWPWSSCAAPAGALAAPPCMPPSPGCPQARSSGP